MQVLAQWDERANNSAEIKDAPKESDVAALGPFRRVGHHNGALGGPQQAGADTKQCTGKNQKAGILVVIVGQNRADVQHVAEPTKTQGQAETNSVGNGPTKEANNAKC